MKQILSLSLVILIMVCSSQAQGQNQEAVCQAPLAPVFSNPVVVGSGTRDSCTEEAFKNALSQGGPITFDCGPDFHTITLTSQARVNLDKDTVIDGKGLISLSGGGMTRIFNMDTKNFERTSPTLTVMNLTFVNGKSSGTKIPLGTHYDGGGGAIYYVGGNVQVFNTVFENNSCDDLGPDLAGGAIFGNGLGKTVVVDSYFQGNHCANGGAIGNLWTSTYIYNSTIENSEARGHGANYEGGEHGSGDGNQQGSGGNGGGIQMDGAENDMLLCGVTLRNNSGNALGGGIFRTTYSGTGTMVIDQSIIEGNVITDQPDFSGAGGLFFMGGPITITNTTFARNQANMFGAIQLEDAHTILTFDGVEVTENTARTGLAAIWIGTGVTGTINNSNISSNSAPGPVSFAAAFAGEGIPGVTLSNTTILNNVAGNGYNPISCFGNFAEGGGNYQWPVLRSGGDSDDPEALCSPDIIVGMPPENEEAIDTTVDMAQIFFIDIKEQYQAGQIITVTVNGVGNSANGSNKVDLWAAVKLPNSKLIFFSGQTSSHLSNVPQPFSRSLSQTDIEQQIFVFDIPSGIGGEYTLYAIYNQEGADISNLSLTLKSNIASRNFSIVD